MSQIGESSNALSSSMRYLILLLGVLPFALGVSTPTVTISAPQATIVGLGGDVEQFPGIPFAKPPTGSLRLKPPQALTQPLGRYNATQNGKACPQFVFVSVSPKSL